jgi:hypothetical protein
VSAATTAAVQTAGEIERDEGRAIPFVSLLPNVRWPQSLAQSALWNAGPFPPRRCGHDLSWVRQHEHSDFPKPRAASGATKPIDSSRARHTATPRLANRQWKIFPGIPLGCEYTTGAFGNFDSCSFIDPGQRQAVL